MMKKLVSIGFATLIAVGCEHDKPAAPAAPIASAAPVASVTAAVPLPDTTAPPPTDSAAAPSASAPAATAANVAPAASQVPTQEDFEKKAATVITAANAAQELTQIEKEIGP
jgi:PBP1b-binding outer membrane lipoprotein LpoB